MRKFWQNPRTNKAAPKGSGLVRKDHQETGAGSSANLQLTLLGNSFERLTIALDPILAVVAVGREQPDHLIGALGGRTSNIAGSEIDIFSNHELVLQRPSPSHN
jgi:hypothetical protein